jgi:hypothetical protein
MSWEPAKIIEVQFDSKPEITAKNYRQSPDESVALLQQWALGLTADLKP